MMMIRTSSTYNTFDTRGEELSTIEKTVVNELHAFDQTFFVVYGYNSLQNSIDSYKVLIQKDKVVTPE